MRQIEELSDKEFFAIFEQYICISYSLKFIHLKQYYYRNKRHFDKTELVIKLRYELNRVLWIESFDILDKDLYRLMHNYNVFQNKQYLQQHKQQIALYHTIALFNHYNDRLIQINEFDKTNCRWFGINLYTNKVTSKTFDMTIIL